MIANTRQSRQSLDQCPLATRPRPSCAVLPFFLFFSGAATNARREFYFPYETYT